MRSAPFAYYISHRGGKRCHKLVTTSLPTFRPLAPFLACEVAILGEPRDLKVPQNWGIIGGEGLGTKLYVNLRRNEPKSPILGHP
jgi:hypothetical protein